MIVSQRSLCEAWLMGLDRAYWNFGVLASQTGVAAITERTQLNGALLAIEEINAQGGIDGRPIRPVIYDPGSVPANFATYARRMLADNNVNIIFGCYMSSQRKAVLPIIREYGALLCYPTMYEGFEFSDNVIYSGAAPNQNNIPMAKYMMEHCGETFCLVGSDYLFPREANRIFKETIQALGGSVLSEDYLPLEADAAAVEPVIDRMVALEPDAIFSTIVGDSTIPFYRGLAKVRAGRRHIPVGSLNTSEAEIAVMGPAVASGHLISMPYLTPIDSETNARFKRQYGARFGGAGITSCTEAAYFQVHLVARAIAEIGTDDTHAVVRALHNRRFAAPEGEVWVDPENNHTYLWPRIAEIGAKGELNIVQDCAAPVKPDPYLVFPRDRDDDGRHLLAEVVS
ncbi:MAG: amino acid ABC transporter substrate-binding protein [Rhodospirillaceae bacterium]|nr:MAG: amino acid ABC transporter substrate-binding protein [Rhodospirillaceae bacterium]